MTSQFNTLFLKWSSSLHSTKKAKWRNTICQPKCWHQSKMCSIYCATSQFPSFSLYPGSNYLRRGHGCEPDTSLKNCKWLCKLVDLDLGVSCWNREMCFTGNDLKFGMPRVLRFKKKKFSCTASCSSWERKLKTATMEIILLEKLVFYEIHYIQLKITL